MNKKSTFVVCYGYLHDQRFCIVIFQLLFAYKGTMKIKFILKIVSSFCVCILCFPTSLAFILHAIIFSPKYGQKTNYFFLGFTVTNYFFRHT